MTATARWSLTPGALQRLLEHLGADPEAAGREYHALRARLVDYFDWRGALQPEVAAEETLDRVARRLEEGEIVERLAPYVYGVARRVLLEQLRLQLREQRAMAAAAYAATGRDDTGEEARVACLARCLRELPEADRALIVAYYEGAGRSHPDERRRLAERLGIGYVALKTRAHRVRVRLEASLRSSLRAEGRR